MFDHVFFDDNAQRVGGNSGVLKLILTVVAREEDVGDDVGGNALHAMIQNYSKRNRISTMSYIRALLLSNSVDCDRHQLYSLWHAPRPFNV